MERLEHKRALLQAWMWQRQGRRVANDAVVIEQIQIESTCRVGGAAHATKRAFESKHTVEQHGWHRVVGNPHNGIDVPRLIGTRYRFRKVPTRAHDDPNPRCRERTERRLRRGMRRAGRGVRKITADADQDHLGPDNRELT